MVAVLPTVLNLFVALAGPHGTTMYVAPSQIFGTGAGTHNVEFARCFLRLANLRSFALDRLSRDESTLFTASTQPV